ncbi:MAG: cytochrome c3 family protein [Desulfosoma sp.]
MKGKAWFVPSVCLAVALFVGALVAVAADAPDVITMNSTLWPSHTKSNVQFTHKKHAEDYKIACAECHHVYEGGKNVWKQGDPVQKCQECHNEPTIEGEKKLPPEQQKLNLKLAMHGNCQECHKKLKAQNPQSTAPTTCVQCHPKKEGQS